MKTQFKNKRAFTLIELLIVIAIIGILFIVLVSRVDFATDKAKATGVQTDFRSFQLALDTVAQENAGFNTFGYNTGDNAGAIPSGYAFVNEDAKKATMGDGIRNSYDEGDKNLNGKQDVNGKDGYTGTTEVFTGRKIYTETWTEVYTLVKPGTTGLDAASVFALESAINKNLDPKLHITIAADGKITMANQARDPWKNEYHGVYISQAERDNGADRGAIIIYSNGANGKWGSAHDITNGVVTVWVPGNNVNGKDDMSISVCYSYLNGFGGVHVGTSGFSNNQGNQATGNISVPNNGNNNQDNGETPNPDGDDNESPTINAVAGLYETGTNYSVMLYTWEELHTNGGFVVEPWGGPFRADPDIIKGDLVLPDGIQELEHYDFMDCYDLNNVIFPDSFCGLTEANELIWLDLEKNEYDNGLYFASKSNPYHILVGVVDPSVTEFRVHSDTKVIADYALDNCYDLTNVELPSDIWCICQPFWSSEDTLVYNEYKNGLYLGNDENPYIALFECVDWQAKSFELHPDTKVIVGGSFMENNGFETFTFNDGLVGLSPYSCYGLKNLTSIILPDSVKYIGYSSFEVCENLTEIKLPSNLSVLNGEIFCWCESLESITIPNTVTSLGAYLFLDCKKLKNVNIPNGVTYIGDEAFADCPELESITIPASVQYLGVDVFNGCDKLTTVNVDANNQYFTTVDGALYSKDQTILYWSPSKD